MHISPGLQEEKGNGVEKRHLEKVVKARRLCTVKMWAEAVSAADVVTTWKERVHAGQLPNREKMGNYDNDDVHPISKF